MTSEYIQYNYLLWNIFNQWLAKSVAAESRDMEGQLNRQMGRDLAEK